MVSEQVVESGSLAHIVPMSFGIAMRVEPA